METEKVQLRDGFQALYAALGQVLEQVDRQLVAERDEHRQILQKLLDSSRLEDAEQSMLLQRITDLKLQMASTGPIASQVASSSDLLQTHTVSTNLVPSNVSSTNLSSKTTEFAALSVKYYKLQHRFNALASNFKLAKDALAKRKVQRDEWAEYASKLAKAIAVAQIKHGIKIFDVRSRSSSAITNPPFEVSSNHKAADAQDQQPQDDGKRESVCHGDEGSTESSSILRHSESTQSEAPGELDPQLPEVPQKPSSSPFYRSAEPPSDTPIFLRERRVRKRKRNNSDSEGAGPRLKSEPTDDASPVMSAIRYASNTQKSLDLGDIEQRVNTPRKPKGLTLLMPLKFEINASSNTSRVPYLAAHAPQHDLLPGQGAPQNQLSILTPLSVNAQNTKPLKDKPNTQTRKRNLGHAISALAEHECGHEIKESAVENHNSYTKALSASDRINVLLNNPNPPENEPVISRPASRRRQCAPASVNNLPIPERRELPFQKGNAPAARSPRVRQLQESPVKTVVRSPFQSRDDVLSALSMRKKPLSELRLDDFKINRLANRGLDFAYAEVVRDKGERACLPGCTDEHCCGKQFRALARSQRPDPPLNQAQRMEERKLLEEYLGDEAYRLASMTGDERDELWLEAKTQQLANRYGKHKHRFSSRQSPPGFWNADFPDTQELEADRVEAAKRERKAIAERHREAMRPGGRWIFRDE